MKKMRAKFHCDSINMFSNGEKEVKLSAVYDDGKPENNQFVISVPSGNLIMKVDNDSVADKENFLVPGSNYYLDFIKAE